MPLTAKTIKRIASVGARRLDWRDPEHHLGAPNERGTVARTLAYLFGFGGILLLATLALPGAPDRDVAALVAISVAALVVAALLVAGFDRLPWWFLVIAPSLGTVLVVLVIGFGGAEASAPYAMYLAWVMIAAAGYLSRSATAVHGAIAVGGYWLALEIVGEASVPMGLQLAMAAGTAAVAAFVMAGLAAQVRVVVSTLEDAARTDPLTGLENRRALREEFGRELARAERTGRPLALVVLDLDHFKRYNDALGHPAGDEALRRVAKILEEVTRSIEVAARIGGEEFAIVAPDADEPGGRALAERLRIAVMSEFSATNPPLTVSCGIAIHRPGVGMLGHQDLFAAADKALYAAKKAGRNRVEVAEERPPLELASSAD